MYRAADVFVFPTLVEGLGLVVLEAMACGLPVIVTSRGPDEVVRDGVDGYVVPAGDSTAIIEALERLYADAGCVCSWGAMRDHRQSAGLGEDTPVRQPIASYRAARHANGDHPSGVLRHWTGAAPMLAVQSCRPVPDK